MKSTLTEAIRQIWPEVVDLQEQFSRTGKLRAARLSDSAMPPGCEGLISVRDVPDMEGFSDTRSFMVVRRLDETGYPDLEKGNVFHGAIYLRKDVLREYESPESRRLLLTELIVCMDKMTRHGDGNVLSSIQDYSSVTRGLEDLWRYRGTEKEKVKSSILIIDTALFAAMRDEPQLIYALNDREFEEYVEELLKRKGFLTELTPRSRDGGKDIVAERTDIDGTHRLIVECKRYAPPNKVGIDVVQRLFGVQESLKATRGIVATSSFFTSPAIDFAADVSSRLTLWDYYDIETLTNDLSEGVAPNA